MQRRTRVFLVLTGFVALSASRPADACQDPPQPPLWPDCNISMDVVPETPVVQSGQPFRVFVTLTNLATEDPAGPGLPPAFQNDRLFDVVATACVDVDRDGICETGSLACGFDELGDPLLSGATDVGEASQWVLLDDAWAPLTDDPTTVTLVFRFFPRGPADRYSMSIDASVSWGFGPISLCRATLCVPAEEVPEDGPIPTAAFEDPVGSGAGGGVVPFSLRVSRNGYPANRPLTVRVIPENSYDPIDLFPIDPPGLATTGVRVLGDDVLLDFDCHLHFPCMVGAHNSYHVTIHDGATLLWDSRWSGQPLGKAVVDEAPMAYLQLVEILGAGCGGTLSSCEGGTIRVRAHARNASFAVPLEDAVLTLTLPEGVTLSSHELHYHDNPMDAYEPTPAELAAPGELVQTGRAIRVDIGTIEARFDSFEGPAPIRFDDLYEVELFLEVPAGGLGPAGALVLDDLVVTASAFGEPLRSTAAALSIPIGEGVPDEVSAPGRSPLRFLPDGQTLTWESCEGSWVDRFAVFRGGLADLRAGSPGLCLASGLLESRTTLDETAPEDLWYYLVNGTNCLGRGSLGNRTTGPRAAAPDCP